jgi:hypothetical protein
MTQNQREAQKGHLVRENCKIQEFARKRQMTKEKAKKNSTLP